MTINRSNGGTDYRVVKALTEQVSQIQEDLNVVDGRIDDLDRDKAEKADLNVSVNTQNLTATRATIGGSTTINSVKLYSPNVDASYLHSQNADFNYVHSNVGYIQAFTTDNLTVNGVTNTFDLNAKRVNVTETIHVPNVITNEITATSLDVAGLVASGSLSTQNASITRANVNDLNVANTLNVKDLNITGSISGLNNVDIEANSITTPVIDAKEIEVGAIYTTETSDDYHLVPTPHLDNNDHYTVMLPKFTGTVVLKWVDDHADTVWTATVIGDGKDYEIHWGTVGETMYVQRIYQYEDKLYIRHNSNGSLYYSYHTTEKLGEITIWYNYTALDDVIWDDYKHDCTTLSGQISFGSFYAPSFTISAGIFDDLTITNSLTVGGLSSFNTVSITNESINWYGNDVKVCNNFTTDWIQD